MHTFGLDPRAGALAVTNCEDKAGGIDCVGEVGAHAPEDNSDAHRQAHAEGAYGVGLPVETVVFLGRQLIDAHRAVQRMLHFRVSTTLCEDMLEESHQAAAAILSRMLAADDRTRRIPTRTVLSVRLEQALAAVDQRAARIGARRPGLELTSAEAEDTRAADDCALAVLGLVRAEIATLQSQAFTNSAADEDEPLPGTGSDGQD